MNFTAEGGATPVLSCRDDARAGGGLAKIPAAKYYLSLRSWFRSFQDMPTDDAESDERRAVMPGLAYHIKIVLL